MFIRSEVFERISMPFRSVMLKTRLLFTFVTFIYISQWPGHDDSTINIVVVIIIIIIIVMYSRARINNGNNGEMFKWQNVMWTVELLMLCVSRERNIFHWISGLNFKIPQLTVQSSSTVMPISLLSEPWWRCTFSVICDRICVVKNDI